LLLDLKSKEEGLLQVRKVLHWDIVFRLPWKIDLFGGQAVVNVSEGKVQNVAALGCGVDSVSP